MKRDVRTWGLLAIGALLLSGFGLSGTFHLFAPSGTSLSAATALGDAQGAPPNGVGKAYPDDTTCYYLLDGKYPYSSSPGCAGSYSSSSFGPIYTGIFSINPASTPSTGLSIYLGSTYHPSYEDDQTLGSACPYGGSLYPQSGDSGPTTWMCTQGESAYPAGCSAYSTPSGYSGVLMSTPTGGGESGWSAYCYAWRTVPASLPTSQSSAGSAPSVSPGQSLTVAWSCLPSRTAIANGCSYNAFDSHCNAYQTTLYSISPSTGASGSGPNFSLSGGSVTGSQTVTAPSTAGTYTYTLSCNGSWGLPSMSIPVTVVDPCPTAAWQPWGNGIYVIVPYATRRVAGALNFCVTNNTGNYIVVPGGGSDAGGQLGAFRTNAGSVGATTF